MPLVNGGWRWPNRSNRYRGEASDGYVTSHPEGVAPRIGGPWLGNNPVADGGEDQFQKAVQVQPVLQIPAMSFHRVEAKIQNRGDLFIRFTFG